MNDAYYEQIVAKKTGLVTILIKTLTITVLVVLLFLSLFNPFFTIALILLGWAAFYFIFPRLSVEYEYSVLNSAFSIDAVFSKASRKHILEFDLKSATQIFPADQFDKNRYHDYTVQDFSGSDEQLRHYAVVLGNDAKKRIIFLSPDEHMLNMMKTYAPRGSFVG